MHTEAYLIGALGILVAWAVLVAFAPQSRRAILWASIAFGHIGPLVEYWHGRTYWYPQYTLEVVIGNWRFGVEDYLFAFAYAGFCAGVFDVICRWWGRAAITEFNMRGFALLLASGPVFVLSMLIVAALLGISTFYATVVSSMLAATAILVMRPELLWPAAISLASIVSLSWFSWWAGFLRLFPGIIDDWWNSDALSGVLLAGVPIEEPLWAGATALFIGPLVRICMDPRTTRRIGTP